MINITNECNMELMARYEDNYFDLAIVDPPYGIDADKNAHKNGVNCKANGFAEYKLSEWDSNIPDADYFNELFRVSKEQIVWGGNYMTDFLPPSMCWLLWDKGQRNFSFADGELAWTSFNKALRIFEMPRSTALFDAKNNGGKIHPTQKPVKLYEWLLMNYAKEGYKILDTHLGSGSIAIACHNLGYDLDAYEIDKEYYEATIKRFNNHTSQIRLYE